MPKYQITSPTGENYEIDTGAQDASEDELISFAQSSGPQGPRARDEVNTYGIEGQIDRDLFDDETTQDIVRDTARRFPGKAKEILGRIPGQYGRAAYAGLALPTETVFGRGHPGIAALEALGLRPEDPSATDVLGALAPIQAIPPFLATQAAGGAGMEALTEAAGGRLKADLPGLGELEWTGPEAGELGEILGGALPVPSGAAALGKVARTFEGGAAPTQVTRFIDNLKQGMPKEVAAADALGEARGLRAAEETGALEGAGALDEAAPTPPTQAPQERFPQAQEMLQTEASEARNLRQLESLRARAAGPQVEQAMAQGTRIPEEVTAPAHFPQTEAALNLERATGEFPEVRGLDRADEIRSRPRPTLDEILDFPQSSAALRIERRTGEFPEVGGPYTPIAGGAEPPIPSRLSKEDWAQLTHDRAAKGEVTPNWEHSPHTGLMVKRVNLMDDAGEPLSDLILWRTQQNEMGLSGISVAQELEGRGWAQATLLKGMQAADAEAPGAWISLSRVGETRTAETNRAIFALQDAGIITTQKLPDGRRQARLIPQTARSIEANVQKAVREFEAAKGSKPGKLEAEALAKGWRPIGGGAEQFPGAAAFLEAEAVAKANKTASVSEQIYGAWVAGRLAGKALFKNVFWNFGLIGLGQAETFTEAGRQAIRQTTTGKAPTVTFSEAREQAAGAWASLGEANTAFLRVWKGGPSHFASTTKLEKATTKFSPIMRKLGFGLPGKILLASDEWAKTVNHRSKVHGLTARALHENGGIEGLTRLQQENPEAFTALTEKINKTAVQEAEFKTLTSQLPTFMENVRRGIQDMPVIGRYLAPFMRTNLNDLIMAVEHIPGLGFMVGQRGDPEISRASKQFIGAVTGLAAYWMTAAVGGKIRGGGDADPAMRNMTRDIPYSITVGGHQFQYDKAGTFGRMLSLIADTKDLWDNIDQEHARYLAVKNIAGVLMDSPAFDSMEKLSNAIDDPEGYGRRYVQQWAGSLAPAGLAQGYQAATGGIQRPSKQAPYMGAPQAAAAAWLGPMSDTPYLRDLWGRKVVTDDSAAVRALSPVVTRNDLNTPLDREMRRLAQATGKGVMPPRPEIGGLKLTEEQNEKLLERSGALAQKRMEQLVSTRVYQRMQNDEVKLEMVRDVFSGARDQARGEMLRDDRKLRKALIQQAREEVAKYRTPRAPGKALEARRAPEEGSAQ